MHSSPTLSLTGPFSRTLVIGILNVTPDSFSDGGRYSSVHHALDRMHAMVDEGADIIDVGGESTRPGHSPVSADEELRRVLPVLERIVPECPVPVSIDTTKPEIARHAIELGVRVINDQWGLQGDPLMAEVAAAAGVDVIAMHNRRGHASADALADPLDDIVSFLSRSLDRADEAGLGRQRVIVDPGFGFGKTPPQNLEVLRRLGELKQLGRPILAGTSRKSMIGRVLGGNTPEDRLEGTAATVALAIANGADLVRVHDVRVMVRVARMTDAVVRPAMREVLAP